MQELFFFSSEHTLLISIWLFCFIILIVISIKNIFVKSNIINNIQAIKLINQDQAIIIDTRTVKVFETGHILNSINVPLENIFSEKCDNIIQYKIFPVILIVNNTYEYNRCVKAMLKYGFKKIYILKNGLYDWKMNHLPLIVKEINNK